MIGIATPIAKSQGGGAGSGKYGNADRGLLYGGKRDSAQCLRRGEAVQPSRHPLVKLRFAVAAVPR